MGSYKIYSDARTLYAAMINDINAAQNTIYFANYCMRKGKAFDLFLEPLIMAVERGVDVRLLLDVYGSLDNHPKQLQELQNAGVKLVWYRPFNWSDPLSFNNRFHKKLLIIDNKVGFTGGVGVGDFWLNHPHYPLPWRDTHFRFTGELIPAMIEAFSQSWNNWSPDKLKSTSETLPDSAINSIRSVPGLMPAGKHIINLIDSASRSIQITTGFFGPPSDIYVSLTSAVKRGVDVTVITNGPYGYSRASIAGGRHSYGKWLNAGVKIFEYQPTAIHAKVYIIDGKTACIGSANLNNRSMNHDEEFVITTSEPQFVSTLTHHFEEDINKTKEVKLENWKKRPIGEKTIQAAYSLGRYFY